MKKNILKNNTHYGVRTENKRKHEKGKYALRNTEYGIRITEYAYMES